MNIYEKMGVTSDGDSNYFVGLMLSLGFLMTRITKKLKLPNVTAYITVGILIGPYVLNLIPLRWSRARSFAGYRSCLYRIYDRLEFLKFRPGKRTESNYYNGTGIGTVYRCRFLGD